MTISPKILFVCFADSSHAQSWISLLDNSGFDVRVYAFPKKHDGIYPPLPWSRPTYSLLKPDREKLKSKVFWILPNSKSLFLIDKYIHQNEENLNSYYLSKVIKLWKPQIIHSLSFEMGAYLTRAALSNVLIANRPIWIISSWGTEIDLGINLVSRKHKLIKCIDQTDWFISDCYRDIENAKYLGLPDRKLPWKHPMPGAGGIDLSDLYKQKKPIYDRKVILIPKAYDNQSNKTIPILEAFRSCEDLISEFKIILLMCSPKVKEYINQLPFSIRQNCICFSAIPKRDVLELLGSSRAMIAPSLFDGTPNVMLEAMAMGALPIMSPIQSVHEWITDGLNGLLAHAESSEEISKAIRRALTDDALFINAFIMNEKIIKLRANRTIINDQVINFYKKIVSGN